MFTAPTFWIYFLVVWMCHLIENSANISNQINKIIVLLGFTSPSVNGAIVYGLALNNGLRWIFQYGFDYLLLYLQEAIVWLCASVQFMGLYSLSGRASYRKISLCLEAASFGFKHFRFSQYDHYNTQSRGFETSRGLTVRRLSVSKQRPWRIWVHSVFA